MNKSTLAPALIKDSSVPNSGWVVHVGAVIVAAAFVAGLYWIAAEVGDPLITKPEFGPGEAERLPLRSALIATVVSGGLLGPVGVALVNRFARKPRRAFTWFAVEGLIAYGVIAFIRADAASTALWFNAMHFAAAAPILGSLFRQLGTSRKPEDAAR